MSNPSLSLERKVGSYESQCMTPLCGLLIDLGVKSAVNSMDTRRIKNKVREFIDVVFVKEGYYPVCNDDDEENKTNLMYSKYLEEINVIGPFIFWANKFFPNELKKVFKPNSIEPYLDRWRQQQ